MPIPSYHVERLAGVLALLSGCDTDPKSDPDDPACCLIEQETGLAEDSAAPRDCAATDEPLPDTGSTADSSPDSAPPTDSAAPPYDLTLVALCAIPSTWRPPAGGDSAEDLPLKKVSSCFRVSETTACPDATTPLPWPEGSPWEPCWTLQPICIVSFDGRLEDLVDTAMWDSSSPDDAAYDRCCYTYVAREPRYECGRPFVQAGERVVATAVSGRHGIPPCNEACPAAADQWLADALGEHASVAAFADLALHLLYHGAPATLLQGVHAAMAEEIEHARAAFALASRFARRPLRAGPLAVRPAAVPTLVDLAVATARDGGVGESLAAGMAAARLATATDPEVRSALARVVAEEARHAALAWAIVAWAEQVGGPPVSRAVHQAVQQAIEDARAATPSREEGPPALGLCGALALERARVMVLETLATQAA